jgi:hypothetical protein
MLATISGLVAKITPTLLLVCSTDPTNGLRMRSLCLVLALAGAPEVLTAQRAEPSAPPLEVGAVAPDFTLNGATRYGLLANPVRLSEFKGKTVVLAFFYKARTSG